MDLVMLGNHPLVCVCVCDQDKPDVTVCLVKAKPTSLKNLYRANLIIMYVHG